MDVEDAFTEEAELRDIITRIYTTNELPPASDDDVNVAMLCFVAGRTYQSNLQKPAPLSVEMTPQLASEFIHFLVERGAP
jgi:hypothetical protein